MLEKEKLKQKLQSEIRESLEHKLVLRREAPLIGLVSFIAALWGAKLFTAMSPGSSLIFQLWGFNIHLHHFNYGFILLVLGLMLTFFEGPWIMRIQHLIFGLGLGLIVDEYWLLLTFDENASVYFGPQSQFLSLNDCNSCNLSLRGNSSWDLFRQQTGSKALASIIWNSQVRRGKGFGLIFDNRVANHQITSGLKN